MRSRACLSWCVSAPPFLPTRLHTWRFCQKGGGAFTLRVLDIGGASDRDTVLLTERWCSSRFFVDRGKVKRGNSDHCFDQMSLPAA